MSRSDERFSDLDLSDPAAIAGLLPHARTALRRAEAHLKEREAELREELDALAAKRDSWALLVAALESVSGTPSTAKPAESSARTWFSTLQAPRARALSDASPPVTDLVVEVVLRVNKPLRPQDVARILKSGGHDLKLESVNNALYHAALRQRRPQIRVLNRGLYAPATYAGPEPAPPKRRST